MKNKFIPSDSRCFLNKNGVRVMIFKDEELFIASCVDSIHVAVGKSMEELRENWILLAKHYEDIMKEMYNIWEPPKPFEYEDVWLKGEEVYFLPNSNARSVRSEDYATASDKYQIRYNKLVLNTEE